jgi:hypothetical protein
MMKSDAEENYSSVSDILDGRILSSAAFVVDSSRMTRIFDPAEAA